jgi:hypothetical protein
MPTMLWWRLWRGLAEAAFSGSLEKGGRFCVGAFGRNLASVTMKMFSHLIYFIKKFYKFCTFNASFKHNAAINCITQKRFIPVNFDGSYYISSNLLMYCFFTLTLLTCVRILGTVRNASCYRCVCCECGCLFYYFFQLRFLESISYAFGAR